MGPRWRSPDLDGSRPDCWRFLIDSENADEPVDADVYR